MSRRARRSAFTEGMQFDKGYISPYMVTDQDRMEATLEDPYTLIANQKIGSVRLAPGQANFLEPSGARSPRESFSETRAHILRILLYSELP